MRPFFLFECVRMIWDFLFLYIQSKIFPGRAYKKIPFIYLDIHNGCNSRCLTCDIWKNDSANELTLDDWESLITQFSDLGVKLVSIGGGEPTLRHDLEEIVKRIKALGISVHLNSHLATIGPSRLQSLIEAGVNAFHISVDAIGDEFYKKIRGINKFAEVERNIAFLLKQKGIFVGINCVVSAHNVQQLEEIGSWAESLGVHKLQFIPASNNLQQKNMNSEVFQNHLVAKHEWSIHKKRMMDIRNKLLKKGIQGNSPTFLSSFEYAYIEKRKFSCFAGKAFLTVDSKGEVLPCYEYSSDLNVKSMKLKEIIASEKYQKALTEINQCQKACHDVGSAEVNIRLSLRRILKNIPLITKELKSYLK